MTILTSGGNGLQGQDGARGKLGADSLAKVWKGWLCPYLDSISSWTGGGRREGGGELRHSS